MALGQKNSSRSEHCDRRFTTKHQKDYPDLFPAGTPSLLTQALRSFTLSFQENAAQYLKLFHAASFRILSNSLFPVILTFDAIQRELLQVSFSEVQINVRTRVKIALPGSFAAISTILFGRTRSFHAIS
jgi:hypothetical protein